MTIEEANVAIYRQYDKIIALTLREMTKHFTPDGNLHLIDFDQDNVEHMYALRIALMARDLWQVKVTVDSTWLKWIRLNWKLRKGFDKVGRTPASWVKVTVDGVWLKWRCLNWRLRKGFSEVDHTSAGWVRGVLVSKFLDEVRAIAKEQVGVEDNFDFSTIYKLYYEGK